jgi:hypothetical protein
MATQRVRTGAIQVTGLRELSRSLKKMDDPAASKELRSANKRIAEMVAEDARGAAYAVGGVAAHVAPSIKASAGQQSAGVALGGSAYPMAGGAEFGSQRYKQFKPWRGNGPDAGYFVYPAIRQDLDRIESEYGKALDELARKVGLL